MQLASDDQPPPAPKDRRKCICAKDSCDDLRQEILKVAPDDHPWRAGNGFKEIRHPRKKFSLTVEALRLSCAFHLQLDAIEAAKDRYCVAHLHWPVALTRKQRAAKEDDDDELL
jgi:hypothetical protein